jgi:hypothetical protein
LQRGAASGFSPVDGGEFDQGIERLNEDDDEDLERLAAPRV